MKARIISIFILLQSCYSFGQVIIAAGTEMALGGSPEITLVSDKDLINNSTYDFSGAALNISLTGTSPQNITGNWTANRFVLHGSSIKQLDGNLTVTHQIEFHEGILRIQSGKLLFTGNGDQVMTEPDRNSYVDGIFYQRGGGIRKYPVGRNAFFAPLIFNDVKVNDAEIGVEVVPENPALSVSGALVEIDNSKYWQIHADDPSEINSTVLLFRRNTGLADGGTVVPVQAEQTGGEAVNLFSGTPGEFFAASAAVVSLPILTLGRVEEVTLTIHNLITPFGDDDVNNRLKINQLEAFQTNKVTLLDRWGVVIKEWTDYDNTLTDYDFRKLTPGNYICIVEATDAQGNTQKKSQMVTVLKVNR